MSRTVNCIKLGREAEGLQVPPYPGDLGQRIFENVSKEACLQKCRSPLGFFLANWRDGRWGALRMGFGHGLFCIGCCWMLMLIMFVGGAMSVITMALLSAFILAERVLPAGPWVARLPGVGLIGWGSYLAYVG